MNPSQEAEAFAEATNPRLRDSYQPRVQSPQSRGASRTSDSLASAGSTMCATSADLAAGEEVYSPWATTRHHRMRPINFKPNGSFNSLKTQGKLSDKPSSASADAYALEEKQKVDKHVPGYTGFVRGSQHIAGRSFGETTRRALTTDYREMACTSPIPSSPQANRHIKQQHLDNTFVSNNISGRPYHVPGYTGFVPGSRHTYSVTYGNATNEKLNELNSTRPAHTQSFTNTAVANGHADIARARQKMTLDSAPLPGTHAVEMPPEFLVPSHLRYLKFFP